MEDNRQDLPPQFLKRMKALLKEEFPAFLKSYEADRVQGFRLNQLKGTRETFLSKNPFSLLPVPWTEEGFFYPAKEKPGKHPYHEAGVYYIQEPSAMAVGTLLHVRPGERILDLCAAPGGKSTQIASQLMGEGLLLSNEVHPARAKILSQNIERMGAYNVVVTNESACSLAERFPCFFDRIVVDAPCSGEGMFRKDENARKEWSEENVIVCSKRQQKLLEYAADMLKYGGRLVYSTCTFAPEENEICIAKFLESHSEFSIDDEVDCESYYKYGFCAGRPDWIPEKMDRAEEIRHTFRLFPHILSGEGHYIAVLCKGKRTDVFTDDSCSKKEVLCEIKEEKRILKTRSSEEKKKKIPPEWKEFALEYGIHLPEGNFVFFGEQLYLVPDIMPDLNGIKVLRPGLHLGTRKKKRFEPSHALALFLKPEKERGEMQKERAGTFGNFVNLKGDSHEVESYLRGETLIFPANKGWCLICVDDYSLGWGKATQGIIKNHYPKGLRRMGG